MEGTAAGIYGLRRLQFGRCGRLGLRPSSLPAVASCVVSLAWFPDSGALAAGFAVGFAVGFHLSLC